MISSRRHRRVGFKARLWLSGSAVWWWRGRRKEWRRVVGPGWALGQARRRIGVILHTSRAVDAGGCASVVLIYVSRVTAAIVINASPIQAVQIRGRLWTRELLLSGKRATFFFSSPGFPGFELTSHSHFVQVLQCDRAACSKPAISLSHISGAP